MEIQTDFQKKKQESYFLSQISKSTFDHVHLFSRDISQNIKKKLESIQVERRKTYLFSLYFLPKAVLTFWVLQLNLVCYWNIWIIKAAPLKEFSEKFIFWNFNLVSKPLKICLQKCKGKSTTRESLMSYQWHSEVNPKVLIISDFQEASGPEICCFWLCISCFYFWLCIPDLLLNFPFSEFLQFVPVLGMCTLGLDDSYTRTIVATFLSTVLWVHSGHRPPRTQLSWQYLTKSAGWISTLKSRYEPYCKLWCGRKLRA